MLFTAPEVLAGQAGVRLGQQGRVSGTVWSWSTNALGHAASCKEVPRAAGGVLLTTAATAELQRDLPSAGLCLEAH